VRPLTSFADRLIDRDQVLGVLKELGAVSLANAVKEYWEVKDSYHFKRLVRLIVYRVSDSESYVG
jgi:hypothetical protein